MIKNGQGNKVPFAIIEAVLCTSVTAVRCTMKNKALNTQERKEDRSSPTVYFAVRIWRVRLVDCQEFIAEICRNVTVEDTWEESIAETSHILRQIHGRSDGHRMRSCTDLDVPQLQAWPTM